MEERAVPAVGRRARTPATFMVVDMSRLCACVSVDGHERLWRCSSRCETWRAFSASRCSSARARVILESIRPYGRTRITDGRNGRGGQTFEHGAAPRAGHNTRRGRTSRSHHRVATRTLRVNEAPNPPLPEERPPGKRARRGTQRQSIISRHGSRRAPQVPQRRAPLAPGAPGEQRQRDAREAQARTQKGRRVQIRQPGEHHPAPRGLRRVHLGRGTLRHERRAGGIRESKAQDPRTRGTRGR